MLSAFTSGATSSGTRQLGSTTSAISQPASTSITGAASSMGSTPRQAARAASARRTWRGCATWITRPDVATPKVRQVWPATAMSANPSTARDGNALCGRVA